MPLNEAQINDIGPAEVIFDGTSTGENETCIFNTSDDIAPVKTARGGTAPVNNVYTGRSVMVELRLTQPTLEQLGLVMPGSAVTGTSPNKALIVSNPVGSMMRDVSKKVIIKPIEAGLATADTAKWIYIPKAGCRVDWQFTFDGEGQNQRTFKVEITGFKIEVDDEVTGWKFGQLFSLGKPPWEA